MGTKPSQKLTVKAPSDRGNFSLMYRITCESFAGGYDKFEIVVEEPEDIPF